MSTIARSQPGFWEAFATQRRVIVAIMLRDLHTRYGRENIGYLWMIAEPMLLASVIGAMHITANFGDEGDIKPIPFAVLGYTVFILFRGIVNRSEGSLEANTSLFYHSQITILDLTFARALIELGGVFITFLCLMSLLVFSGLSEFPARPLAVLAAWGLMFWYCLANSLIITAISHDNRTIGRLCHPYTYFMVGLSGAFIRIGWIPHPFREVLTYIPLTSVFELARYGWFNSANLDYFFPTYLIGASAIGTWIGLVLCSRLREKVHVG